MFCQIPADLEVVFAQIEKKLRPWYDGNVSPVTAPLRSATLSEFESKLGRMAQQRINPFRGIPGAGQVSNTFASVPELTRIGFQSLLIWLTLNLPLVSDETRRRFAKEIISNVFLYELIVKPFIDSWHRGCIQTQRMVWQYLHETLTELNRAAEFVVKGVCVGNTKNESKSDEHHAVLIHRQNELKTKGFIVDPWICQDPAASSMVHHYSHWQLWMSGLGPVLEESVAGA